jgi:hypothetical protein
VTFDPKLRCLTARRASPSGVAVLSTLITGLNGRSNFERNGGAPAPPPPPSPHPLSLQTFDDISIRIKRNRYERSILLQSVVLLYGEGIVAGCEDTLDELRRVRSCILVSQR